jgi:predicted HAD superfamily Cof-like phosphohydrolase
MTDLWSRVLDFMQKRDQHVAPRPAIPPDDVVRQRCRWQLEETFELLEACFRDPPDQRGFKKAREAALHIINNQLVNVDLVAYADANADIRYVAYGNDIAAGIDGRETDAEVARSNETKGPCGPDGKVSKGPTYSPPDIAGVLKDQGWKP